jgi:hypothetical protein
MTLGSGIFFAALVLALSYLYVKSENKARWRKVILYITLGLLILFIVLMGYAFREKFLKDSLFSATKSPSPPNQLSGITIGSKLSDVQFKHGEFFLQKEKDVCRYERYSKQKPSNSKSKTTKHDDLIRLEELNGLQFCVKEQIIEQIIYSCNPYDDLEPAIRLHHIKCGDSSERILHHYKTTKTSCSKENPTIRIYDVDDLKMRFILDTNKVIYLWASNGEFPENSAFSICK